MPESKIKRSRGTTHASTPDNPNATRDHLANERTLLAWSRTGITVIGLGFVVARFGLLIRELSGVRKPALPSGFSTAFGVALVICGALLVGVALIHYLRVANAIRHNQAWWSPTLAIALTSALGIAAILLALYLLLTA